METLLFSFNAVVPVFILIGMGYAVRKRGWLDERVVRSLNLLCFRLLLPAPLFKAAYTSSFSELFDAGLVLMQMLFFILSALIMIPVAHLLTDSNRQRGAMVQGAFRSNMVMLGIAFTVSLVGEAGAAPAAILVAIGVPLSNVLGVLVLTAYAKDTQRRTDVKNIALSLITNPMILAGLAGIALSLLEIRFWPIVERPIFELAAAAPPLTMLLLGGQLDFRSAAKNLRLIAATMSSKLILLPLLGTLFAVWMGYRGAELCALYVVLATPAATTTAAMADSMGADSALATEIVTFSTAASVVTIFIGSFLLKFFGLI